MNTRPKYLTKSRFRTALECPTKLFYTAKDEYPDKKAGDSFLEALAEGGFQVGELAKLYYEGGRDIKSLDKEEALEETARYLLEDPVVLYEAAFRYENLFVRADILERRGDEISLIEVKAKSADFHDSAGFLNAGGCIKPKWEPYIYDVAFQYYVLKNAMPDFRITPYLLLADKNAEATVDGLNQRFLIRKNAGGRTETIVREGTARDDLGEEILVRIDVSDLVERILAGTDRKEPRNKPFGEWVRDLAQAYEEDRKIIAPPGGHCKTCEFRASPAEKIEGKKSGFEECWRYHFELSEEDFARPTLLDLWDFRKKDACLEKGKIFLEDLTREDIGFKENGGEALGRTERQWLQIEKTRTGSDEPYIARVPLRELLESWRYPFHFIDFETTAPALPFTRGLHPYEGIAFQYSHHQAEADGTVRHAGEYLHRHRGSFPSFDFLRRLKGELENDRGTIFRYADHENTYLNIIHNQLRRMSLEAVPDRDELISFIEEITHPPRAEADLRSAGPRDMVDLRRIVLDYLYLPGTGGSNSIKAVVPAVLEASEKLRKKYGKPIYGKGLEIDSLNFEKMRWVRYDEDGKVIDPYKLLPPVFDPEEEAALEYLLGSEKLAEGGAAMTAYGKMQYTEMSCEEEEKIAGALLKYCELDTFAMVLLYEYLKEAAYEGEDR